jgi:hypothetical protein
MKKMKKIVLIVTLFIGGLGFAQQEVKIDIADALVIRSLEFSYESYMNKESSYGISLLFNLEDQEVDFRYNENVIITPYFRNYFTLDAQWNLFGEAFLSINSGKINVITVNNSELQKYTDTALGIAVGTKYISDSGLVIDIYAGAGRNLFGSIGPVVVPRAGLNIGWRF